MRMYFIKFVGFLPGIACNKFPPWAVLLVGCGFCFLGYGVLWLAVSQTIASMPFVVVSHPVHISIPPFLCFGLLAF